MGRIKKLPKKCLQTVKFFSFIKHINLCSGLIPSIVVLSLLVAVLMNRKVKGLSIYRTIYFLPVVAAPSAVAMIWRWMFNNDYGLINNMLAK